jgi:hypothetical protein
MSSRTVSDTTKMYIRSSNGTFTGAINSYNRGVSEDKQIKTGQSKVDYDRKKLGGYFTINMIECIIYQKDCDLLPYKRMLSVAR